MRNFHTFPSTDVVAVITDDELADWLGVDNTDPLLPAMSVASTSAIIEFLQFELITRERVTVYEDWPTVGTNTAPSLSPNDMLLNLIVDIPYARLTDPVVLAVEAGGAATTEYRILEQLPAALYFNALPVLDPNDAPALRMTYNAGYGAIGDVPKVIKTAVTMVAAYLYDHRGECSAEDAIKLSGADIMLTPYKAKVILL